MNLEMSQCQSAYVQFAQAEAQESSNPWDLRFKGGTAGETNKIYVLSRLKQGAIISFAKTSHSEVATPKTDVELIIGQLQPSMSQLGAAFGVTRQTIYDWRAGKGISPENTEQLKRLVAASTRLNRENLPPRAGDRQLPGGKTFWESLASGMTPNDAVERLSALLDRERKERGVLLRIRATTKATTVTFERPLFADTLGE